MKLLVCVLVVAFLAWFGYSMYRDGYTTGMFEERRKRIRSLQGYNRHLGELRAEIDSLKAEIEDIRENMPACTKPYTDQVLFAKVSSDENFEPKSIVEEVESDVRTAG